MNKIIRYIPEANLRGGYDSLRILAKKSGIDLLNIGQGEFVVFVNRKKDKMKVATQNDVVAYHRTHNGNKINPLVISRLPKYFSGGVISYEGAIKETILQAFPNYFKRDLKQTT